MKRFPIATSLLGNIGRATGGLLVAAGILMTSSGIHPRSVFADYGLGAPTLLSVSLDAPDALVTFRDNSSQEIGYNVYALAPSKFELGRRVQTTGVPGQGRVKTATVDRLQPNTRYCFRVAAIGQDGVTDS